MSKDPKIILEILSKNNSTVDDLYRYLYIPEFYKLAYQNICSKPSQMTPASDGTTVDGMGLERINKLIQKLKDRTYRPTIIRRVNIPKNKGDVRRISIPSFEDKLVQEVIRMILEALYEHTFSNHNHGFRPQKSCHTALEFVQKKFQGTKWWINCDIRDYFDNINHQILLKILAERIKEQKFLSIINKFLKAGYIENWQYNKTHSGIPQGSIIGPILSNIYLDKFDKFMEKNIETFWKGKSRARSAQYNRLQSRVAGSKKSIVNNINIEENRRKYKERKKELNKFVKEHGVYDFFDPNFRRLSYVRYADNFLIGVVASKKEAIKIKEQIEEFLEITLKIKLNEEKSKIIHNSKLVRFLGYDLSVIKGVDNVRIRGIIALWLPYEVCKNFIIDNRFGKFVCDAQTGKPKLKAIHRPEMNNNDELEILMIYNTKIRGLYNYYKMASNVCKLNYFNDICQTSFLKTLANKYKTSVAKIYANPKYNHRKNNSSNVGITYNNKFYEFFDGPFKIVKKPKFDKNIDDVKNVNRYFGRTSLIQRLDGSECEICHTTIGPFEVHHVRKLKDLKNKKHLKNWEKFMISRNRKTLVLCKDCHRKLHANKL